MAHAAGDAHEYPIRGYHFRVTFPILDADGDLVTAAGSPDSEVSKDAGTFADCTNEATELATSSGMYYLDLTGAELEAKQVAVIVKSTSNKTTPITLYPRYLPTLETGTAQTNGNNNEITLASGSSAKDDFYNGLFVGITNNSPAGADNQVRRIIDYVGSSKVATVDSNWGTNPTNASTYEILIPEGYDNKAWAGKTLSDPAVDGVPKVTVGAGGIAAAAFAAGAIDAAAIADNAIDAAALASDVASEIRSVVLGVADSGSTTTMVDAARTEADTDYWKGCYILFTNGNIAGQCRLITGFTPSSDTITFSPATTQAVATNNYEILPAARVDLELIKGSLINSLISGRVDANAQVVGDKTGYSIGSGGISASSFAAGAIDATAIASGAIDADALASDAVTEIRSVASGTADSGSTTTMVDAARTEADTDYWKGNFILFTSGTIAGQCRLITAFTPASDTITFTPATTQAVGTNTYEILPAADISDAVWAKSMTELASVPGVTGTVLQALEWCFLLARNKRTCTATTETLRNDADSASIATATVSDDTTTFTRTEWA